MKVLQYNAGRGRAATHECLREATVRGIQVLLLQEPYVGVKACMSAPSGCRVIQSSAGNVDTPVRSAIVITDPNIDFIENSKFVQTDIAGAIVKIGSLRIGLISVYLDKELDLDTYLAAVKRIVEEMRVDRVLVGGDVNARSPWWGCLVEDERGLAVSESLAALGLEVLNQGDAPTYLAYRSGQACCSIIDVTACSASLLPAVHDWKVDDTLCTLSDHRPITLTLRMETRGGSDIEHRNGTRIYDTDKADWCQFRTELERLLSDVNLEGEMLEVRDGEGVNRIAEKYTDCIIEACDKAIPRISSRNICKACKWWTAELAQLKAEMVRRRRRIAKANPRRKRFVVDHYLEARKEYRHAIESTITQSWKDFCTGEKTETVWKRSYRIMKACTARVQDRLLETADGSTLDERESAQLLAETFFPRDEAVRDTPEQAAQRAEAARLVALSRESVAENEVVAFTVEELETVLRAMSPKKAPGGDGLTLDICLKAHSVRRSLLLGLFSLCLQLGCFPRIWKTATIKVIPKPAREDYTKPKSYRPIGLLPVLGKMLEKLFVNRLQWQLGREERVSPLQYGFMPQRSSEDALFDAMTMVRDSLEKKEIVVMVSLDIAGAFDNAWWPAIISELHAKRVEPSVLRLIVDYLSERRVSLRYAGHTVERDTNKGCIQGSTCGPILWNIQLDPLLEQAQYGGVRVQAFADDILLVAAAPDGLQLEASINRALEVIVRWAGRLGLNLAPEKTQALIITRKMRYHTPRLVLAGTELSYGDSLRVLGLTIDPLLNFRRHLELTTKKAIAFYKVVSRAARAQWGLNSNILRLIYVAVVEPTVLYSASCWADISGRVYAEKALLSLTRAFAIKISKAHRTVSTVASLLLARLLPLPLRVREHAAIHRAKRGEPFACLPGREIELRRSPYSLPHPAKRKRIEFGLIGSQADVESLGQDGLVLYTDGSKLEGKVGAAVSCWIRGIEVQHTSFRLENYCSVFQAELAAILQALAVAEKRREETISIASDSRSGLETIRDPNTVNPLAVDIRESVLRLAGLGKRINWYWVRAHCGIQGNERADELAKYAALNNRQPPRYDRFPLSFAKHSTRSTSIEEWQHTYETATAGATTRLFFKRVTLAYKILNTLTIDNFLTQIFTGHGGFNFYLHRFKLADSPLCSCGEDTLQTIQHLLLDCLQFARQRYDCESAMETSLLPGNLEAILGDDDCRPKFLNFARTVLRSIGKQNGSFLEPVN